MGDRAGDAVFLGRCEVRRAEGGVVVVIIGVIDEVRGLKIGFFSEDKARSVSAVDIIVVRKLDQPGRS